VRVLRSLNDSAHWRQLFGNKSKRLKDMEMILRFLAFYYYSKKYRSPMKDFLNRYMAQNRDLAHQSEKEITTTFNNTVAAIAQVIGHRAFRPVRAINAAVIDSLMTGVARRLASGPIRDEAELLRCYEELLNNKKYRDAVETGTSQEANVATRLDEATKAFASVK
jgi:hypothetical protein